jgi:hypothetical protein
MVDEDSVKPAAESVVAVSSAQAETEGVSVVGKEPEQKIELPSQSECSDEPPRCETRKDDPVIEDLDESEGKNQMEVPRSMDGDDSSDDERLTLRKSAAAAANPLLEPKGMDAAGRAQIMELHSKGKNPLQIKNNYLLGEYCLSEDAVLAIIREGEAERSPASVQDKAPKTYSPQELKEWLACVKNGDLERMRELMRAHPSLLNAQQAGIGHAALHWAAARDSKLELNFLLESKADLNVRNSAGATPLHSAATNGKVGALTSLLAAGADVTMQDENNDTPCQAASRREDAVKAMKCLQLLSFYLCTLISCLRPGIAALLCSSDMPEFFSERSRQAKPARRSRSFSWTR